MSSLINVEQLKNPDLIRNTFDFFDRDRSGKITLENLRDSFYKLQLGYSNDDINSIFEEFDIDGDGSITFDEFY